jgi:rhamnogalacturonyl hydrolase YesR
MIINKINKPNNMKRIILSVFMLCLISSVFSQSADTKKLFDKKYIKSTMEKVALWQLDHPKFETGPNDWTNGAFYAGVFAAWETTHSDAIYKAMMDMGESVKWSPGTRWYHADDVAICQTYIDLYRKEKHPEMIQPVIDTLTKFMTNAYPARGFQAIRWWWCDALFMAPPTMVKLGMTTGNMEYLAKSDEYFKECYDLLYNKEEHLFSRDLNYVIKGNNRDRYEANGKRIFWSRGNGWVMGGLVRILQELPKNYSQRPFYEQLYKEMAAKIITLQQPDGLWRTSLLDPDSYSGGEVSGSGFYCYALAWGINNGMLDKKVYLPVVKKTWIALNGCVNDEGRVGWVQPIGSDPRKNFGPDTWEVYGSGAFLLAGSEVIKLK